MPQIKSWKRIQSTLHGIVGEAAPKSEAETEASGIVQNPMRIVIPKKWSLETLWKRTIQSWNRVVYRSETLFMADGFTVKKMKRSFVLFS